MPHGRAGKVPSEEKFNGSSAKLFRLFLYEPLWEEVAPHRNSGHASDSGNLNS